MTSGDRTGIAALDAVITTVETGDPASFNSHIQFTRVPCTVDTGAGQRPRCGANEDNGTMVDGLTEAASGRCASPTTMERRDQVDGLLTGLTQYRLYAIVRQTDPAQSDQQAFLAIFAKSVSDPSAPVTGVTLAINDGAVTEITRHCGMLPELISGVASTMFVLPPRALPGCDAKSTTPVVLCEASD
jgi:hypothetical protein